MAVRQLCFLFALCLVSVQAQYDAANCPVQDSAFELVTGYMYSSPGDILETRAGVLKLAECLKACLSRPTCEAVNYEVGLCVLFSTQATDKPDSLIKSMFPVFTYYAHKLCLPSARMCDKAFAFELVRGYSFKNPGRKQMEMPTRMACLDACLQEREFYCRSAAWDQRTGLCVMADFDRYSQPTTPFLLQPTIDYMESQCVPEPNKMCEFKKIQNRLLKTVDSLVEGVSTIEECKQMCLNAPYRCHTFDFEGVCRLSHHSAASVAHIEEPYLEMNGSSSWEKESCYNVSLDCQANKLVAKITTSKIFSGKVYSKARPNSCYQDVKNALDFEIEMDYSADSCGVRQSEPGRYETDLILQHHKLVMTASDLGFALRCSFQMENRSVSHGIELQVNGLIQSMGTESAIVPSPNVQMLITDRSGGSIGQAQVGDPLALRFEIVDSSSPYEIFVRELVAMDGIDGSEILLIDTRGCPTDQSIMQSVTQVSAGKTLQAFFEAFKFPTSSIVQFQALITPCLPRCEPVNCSVSEDAAGLEYVEQSYGRRKRRSTPALGEQLFVINQLKIADPFTSEKKPAEAEEEEDAVSSRPASCLNLTGLLLCGIFFVLLQFVLVVSFCIWKRKRSSLSKAEEAQQNYICQPHPAYMRPSVRI